MELKTVLKRTSDYIFDKGGIIRNLNYLGFKDTPYKISKNKLPHRSAHYFVFKFDAPPSKLFDLKSESDLDVDIIRCRIFNTEQPEQVPCTLDAEMLPPPYRKEVQEMVRIAKKNEKKNYDFRTGLDFYPFQR